MAMENPFEGKEIWFGVGSQDLYGEEALRQVAQQTGEMVDFLNATGKIPAKIVLKPTLKSSDGVKAFMTEASANPNVIGVITWCHTFSPAKMWIRGLEVLTKPLLQLATQHHKEIPWETIDMDFMNLNQAAHGDREFGYIVSRLGIPRKIVVGHYTDPEVAEKVGTWARACAGWDASQNMKVMRWGDNMRNVAVTEGDKTEAERVFGASINTWAVNDLVAAYEKVKDSQVKDLIEDYKAKYDVAPELLDSRYDELFIAAKEEAAMVNMMRENGCTAGVDNFEDLGTLPQDEFAARLANHPQVLCVVNRRKTAQQLYESLPAEGSYCLTTLLCAADRRRQLDDIRQRLKEGLPCRVVSTSLIEAGVDVDFPVAYREQCGLDSLLQTAGRCNREGRRGAEESIVYRFRLDECSTPQMLRQNVSALDYTARHQDTLDTPRAIQLYFNELSDLRGPDAVDKHGILDAFLRGIRDCQFPFAQVAEEFRLIENAARTVYLPVGEGAALCEQLRSGHVTRTLLRKLGVYSVSCYKDQFDKLDAAGALELRPDGSAILTDTGCYSEKTGLAMDVETGIGLYF